MFVCVIDVLEMVVMATQNRKVADVISSISLKIHSAGVSYPSLLSIHCIICMYVCMYVCIMYVCVCVMNVCMYV